MRAVRIEPIDRVVSQDHPLKVTCPQNGYTQLSPASSALHLKSAPQLGEIPMRDR